MSKESKIFYQVDFDQFDLEAIYQVLALLRLSILRHRLSLGLFNANPEQLTVQNQVEKMIEERLSPEAFEEVVSSGAENKLEENNEILMIFFPRPA